MLTKDLLRYRKSKDGLKPRFINTEDPALIQLADLLLSAYNPDRSPSRSEIQEAVLPHINACKDVKLSRGFNKLLLDRCEFNHPEDRDYAGLRRKVFLVSARLLKKENSCALADYTQEMMDTAGVDPAFLTDDLYSDLPENERLRSFKKLSPKQLLERYNCSLVQSLLLHAKAIRLTIIEPNPGKMRRLFQYLKFFRLLTRIFRLTPGEKDLAGSTVSDIRIEIDGPLSLFENTKKYGLQLASFFPAVCDMHQWRIETEITLRGKPATLTLSQKSGLVGHYRHFHSYIPEEITGFHRLFAESGSDWEIVSHTPFLETDTGELIFPDISFQDKGGRVRHLELFHRWHSTGLMERLEFVESHPDTRLIIGVDRFLSKKPIIQERLDSSPWFRENGFLFRDFPVVSTVLKRLG